MAFCVQLLKLIHRISQKTISYPILNRFICCYMCSLVEILCVIEEKIWLVWWQLLRDIYATDILWFHLLVNFVCFLSKWISSGYRLIDAMLFWELEIGCKKDCFRNAPFSIGTSVRNYKIKSSCHMIEKA